MPEKKLKLVMADKDLYKACAVEVKRQIWQDNQALFGDEVSPLLKQYILEKENILFSNDISVLHNFFSPSPKARRQGEVREGNLLQRASECCSTASSQPHHTVECSFHPSNFATEADQPLRYGPFCLDQSTRNYFNSCSMLCNYLLMFIAVHEL